MQTILRKILKPLFTTRSGIVVHQAEPVLPKMNLLVRYNRTGETKLNGKHISDAAYRRLLRLIDRYHPEDVWHYANTHQVIVTYPKFIVGDC